MARMQFNARKNGDNKKPGRFSKGWRAAMIGWLGVAIAILIINVSVLIWARVKKSPSMLDADQFSIEYRTITDTTVLSEGSCSTASHIKIGVHIAVNILGALLLLASQNCMQCLGSPTRDELDRAHSKNVHLDIGILSARNLLYINVPRLLFWIALSLSSIPLHLFYNSVIISTIGAREVFTGIVSSDFVTEPSLQVGLINQILGKSFSYTASPFALGSLGYSYNQMKRGYSQNSNITQISEYITAELQSAMPNSPTYNASRLDLSTCLEIFSQRTISNYSSIVLVLNITNSSGILDLSVTQTVGYPQPWTCIEEFNHISSTKDMMSTCSKLCPDFWHDDPATDYCLSGATIQPVSLSTPRDASIIQYCLVQPAEEHCTIELIPSLLIVVIVMNLVKVIVIVCTMYLLNFTPIVTVGDAINSFLRRRDGPLPTVDNRDPDPSLDTTQSSNVHTGNESNYPGRLWQDKHERWFSAVSRNRWIWTIGICLAAEATAAYFLNQGFGDVGLAESVNSGLGALDGSFFTPVEGNIKSILLSNLPQLLISTIYILYNSLIATMLLVSETSDFAENRKALRVSPPRNGYQRSTYWLSVPSRYALPILIALSALHFLISQSISVVRVNLFQLAGTVRYNCLNGFGYSPVAIIAAMSLGAVLILIPLILGFRRFPAGIPIMGHNSQNLAVACFADKEEPDDGGASLPLMYGVLPTPGSMGLRRTGFSSLSVEPLYGGQIYEAIRNPWSRRPSLEPGSTAWTSVNRTTSIVPAVSHKPQGAENVDIMDGISSERQIIDEIRMPPVV